MKQIIGLHLYDIHAVRYRLREKRRGPSRSTAPLCALQWESGVPPQDQWKSGSAPIPASFPSLKPGST